MQSFIAGRGAKPRRKAAFLSGLAICSLFGWFLPTPILRAHTLNFSFAAIPAAPGNLTAKPASNSRIDLAWSDNSTNEIGFTIERKKGAAGAYGEVAVLGANVRRFSDSNLIANTVYFYRIRAYNAGGFSAYANEASAKTLLNALAAPSHLTAQPVSTTRINLAWTDNSNNETGFKIERKVSAATNYTLVATAGANVTSFADTSLDAETPYFFRVRAYNAEGHSAYSAAVSATTLPAPPSAPNLLSATVISQTQINLAWTDNSNSEAGFTIARKLGSAGTFVEIDTVAANTTSFAGTDLKANAKYFYRVRAYNLSGYSAYSNLVEATTLRKPPAAPSALTANAAGKSQINLEWLDNATNEDSFKIERKIPPGAFAEIARIGANVSSFSNTGLQTNAKYFYRVRSSNNGGLSDFSNEANTTTLPDPPATPKRLITTAASNSKINLAWADSSDNESGFKIERKMDTVGVYAEIAVVPANVMNYSDVGLSPASEYFYRVRAHNVSGHSDYSNEANAITASAPGNMTTVLVPQNAIWKYNASGADLGASWREASYNDGSWPSGPAALGFGEGYLKTILPSKQITYYFRHSFALAEAVAAIKQLTLLANYDDGFIAYLNGQEVARQAMPGGTISSRTLASFHEGGTHEIIDLSAHLDKLVPGHNVLAVEMHQNTANSNDLAMSMKLEYRAPSITRGPYLQAGGATQTIVRWRTNLVTSSRVQYGVDPSTLALVADDTAMTTEHEMKLTGLAPGTKYYYAVGTKDGRLASGNDFYFVTAPATGKKTRIWVLGDAGTANADQIAVRDAYYNFTGATHTDLWVMLGDNAYAGGADEEYQAAVFEMYPAMLRKSVLWPAFGNHDAGSASSAPPKGVFYNIFTLPAQGEAGGLVSGTEAYYSFDFANLHFICLNSEDIPRATTGAMLTWLQRDLAANTKPWTIAFWHHPPYSKGSHDSDANPELIEMRQNALPILENGGVDLVLTGHSHSYERTFLLDGHYGASGTLTGNMILDGGSGRVDGDGAYNKPTLGPASHQGAVYVVAGSSGKISGGKLDHPAMYVSLNALGSVVLDADNNRIEATFLDQLGTKRDYFTISKGASSLAAPGLLTAMAITSSRLNLSWTDHSNDEAGFKIERKSGANGTYTVIGNVGANVTAYADTNWAGGSNYFYRVRAYSANGNSAYSNETTANLAFNKAATASITATGSTSPQAVDGSTNTAWHSGNVGSNAKVWWRVDLGSGYSINRVVIKWQSSYYAKNYAIQVSDDDAVYNPVYTESAGNGGADEAAFVPTAGRYVRIYMTKHNSSGERMNEVEVYGGASAVLGRAADNAISAAVIPKKITLAQNYPNPFSASGTFGNPATTLSYALPADAHVTLNVVNLNGQIVATLANRRHARGVYQVTFDASGLPSGIYFAILKAGEVTKTQRMLFMK